VKPDAVKPAKRCPPPARDYRRQAGKVAIRTPYTEARVDTLAAIAGSGSGCKIRAGLSSDGAIFRAGLRGGAVVLAFRSMDLEGIDADDLEGGRFADVTRRMSGGRR